jgi:hypothetical protein
MFRKTICCLEGFDCRFSQATTSATKGSEQNHTAQSPAINLRSRCGSARGWPVLSSHCSPGAAPQVGQKTARICFGLGSFFMEMIVFRIHFHVRSILNGLANNRDLGGSITNLISRPQLIGGHGVAPCEAGQRQVHNALLAVPHRSGSGQPRHLWE